MPDTLTRRFSNVMRKEEIAESKIVNNKYKDWIEECEKLLTDINKELVNDLRPEAQELYEKFVEAVAEVNRYIDMSEWLQKQINELQRKLVSDINNGKGGKYKKKKSKKKSKKKLKKKLKKKSQKKSKKSKRK